MHPVMKNFFGPFRSFGEWMRYDRDKKDRKMPVILLQLFRNIMAV